MSLTQSLSHQTQEKKIKLYKVYTNEEKEEIIRAGNRLGSYRETARFLKQNFGWNISNTTVRRMMTSDNPFKIVKMGRPPMLQCIDEVLLNHLKKLKSMPSPLNTNIVIATGMAFIMKHDKIYDVKKLNADKYRFCKTWAQSVLKRLNGKKSKLIAKTKSNVYNKKGRDLRQTKKQENVFLNSISDAIIDHVIIYDELIFNIDEIEMEITTSEKPYLTKISIIVGISLSGDLLPFQIIYSEKDCHIPSYVPKFWDVTCTSSGIANSTTMNRYLEKILKPHIKKVKRVYKLSSGQKTLLVLDKNKVHQGYAFAKSLNAENIHTEYIPAGMTKINQPIDVQGMVGVYLKTEINRQFQELYCNITLSVLDKSYCCPKNWKPTIQFNQKVISHWIQIAHENLKTKSSTIPQVWKKSNIEKAIRRSQKKIK